MIDRGLDVGGAVTFWSLADWSDRARLRDAFDALGLAAFVPDPRPAPACLRDALEDVLGGPRVLVRPLATRDGFAVVNEDRGAADNAYQAFSLHLTINANGEVTAATHELGPVECRG